MVEKPKKICQKGVLSAKVMISSEGILFNHEGENVILFLRSAMDFQGSFGIIVQRLW
jgi:hypothetical protein